MTGLETDDVTAYNVCCKLALIRKQIMASNIVKTSKFVE